MPDQIDTRSSWLSDEAIEAVRGQVPLVYVEALPVRVDERGTVTHAGLLLRVRPDGSISRTIVSGRVLVEYFPDPEVTGFSDPRHHAVSLVYVVPVDGDCQPSQQALDLAWLTPEELADPVILSELAGGHDRLVRMALAHVGCLH
jgi:hypothetical protein